MTGLAYKIYADLNRQLRDTRLWRQTSFMHQLSESGAMLWAPNHDRNYLDTVCQGVNMPGAEWQQVRERLVQWPAGQVRGLLWSASEKWLQQMLVARPAVERFIYDQGLQAPPSLIALDDEIILRRKQLQQMSWCITDQSEQAIDIVE